MSQTIDLRRVVAAKSPALTRRIPSFVYRILNRLLHVRDINLALRRFGEYEGHPFVVAMLEFLDLHVESVGDEHLAAGTRPVVVSNHPLGGLGGLALMAAVGRHDPDYVVPVNDFLMNLPNLRPCFVPVNKHGSNWKHFSQIIDAFTSDRTVVHFPSGLCSRKHGHLIRDLAWHKAFITKARDLHRTVIPTFIEGRNSRRFYRIAQLRERTGWRFNIEMILLADEMFRQRGKTLRIVFGPPLKAAVFDRRHSDRDWAEILRRYVYALNERPTLDFESYAREWRGR